MDAVWLERSALRYVARWESTRQGVALLLERKVRQRCDRTAERCEPALALIPEIVERLQVLDYINDLRFATMGLERLRRRGRSRAQIHAYMQKHGVPDSITDEVLQTDAPGAERQAASRLASQRRLGPYCPDPVAREANRDQHLAALARRGFSRESALRVIDGLEFEA
jgi:SOS response regulatory protein OraA/RecX